MEVSAFKEQCWTEMVACIERSLVPRTQTFEVEIAVMELPALDGVDDFPWLIDAPALQLRVGYVPRPNVWMAAQDSTQERRTRVTGADHEDHLVVAIARA